MAVEGQREGDFGARDRVAAQHLANQQRLGAAGRAMVHDRFSVASWAPEFAALIDRLPAQAGSLAPDLDRFATLPLAEPSELEFSA